MSLPARRHRYATVCEKRATGRPTVPGGCAAWSSTDLHSPAWAGHRAPWCGQLDLLQEVSDCPSRPRLDCSTPQQQVLDTPPLVRLSRCLVADLVSSPHVWHFSNHRWLVRVMTVSAFSMMLPVLRTGTVSVPSMTRPRWACVHRLLSVFPRSEINWPRSSSCKQGNQREKRGLLSV